MTLKAIKGGDGAPPEPDWSQIYDDPLDIAIASEIWVQVVGELSQAQAISFTNGKMIERLSHFTVQYTRAARDVAARGMIIAARKTRVPQVNPHWAVMRQASEEIKAIEIELGIPPVRRGKVTKVDRKSRARAAADEFLRIAK